MGWTFECAYNAFSQYREMWDEINRGRGNHILLDSLFVEPLIRYFASSETLLGISTDADNPGLVLVDKIRKGFWQTFQPSQEPLGLILLRNPNSVMEQVEEMIADLPGYALGFAVLQQDPHYTAFGGLNPCRKLEKLDYIETARLSLNGKFEDYWKSRSKNIVHNLSRQRRRLGEQGIHLKLAVDRDPGQVAVCLEEYGRLEGAGWKSRQGTAVIAGSQQGIFYREMLENFCRQGEGVIYRLLFNNETVASDLCLSRGGMMVILKTAYNESIKGFSLGLLLHQEIFETLFSEGKINIVEFYGRLRDWHMKWTDEIRTMYHINFYRYGYISTARRLFKSTYQLLSPKSDEV